MQSLKGQKFDQSLETNKELAHDASMIEQYAYYQEGFEQFALFEIQIFRYLLKKVDVDTAEDLLSEIRLHFSIRWFSLKDQSQTKAFIFQMTRDALRKRWLNQRRLIVMEHTPTQAAGTNPEFRLLEKERLALVKTCLMAIPNQTCKQVATLRFMMGLPQAQISEQLNMSIDRVKKFTAKAKVLIAKCVRRKLGRGMHGTF